VKKKLEFNHICANSDCRKEYYSCDYCSAIASWRSVACSLDCYHIIQKAQQPVEEHRTDITDEELQKIKEMPIAKVKEKTLDDLSDYVDVIEESGIAGAIEVINNELDNKAKSKSKNPKVKIND